MITAVDTNVLIDILARDPEFAFASRERVRSASQDGALVICEIVYAELSGRFSEQTVLDAFLRETGISLKASESKTLWKAGVLWRDYRVGHAHSSLMGRRILADFLIGAHASLQADQFLTRDQGFYRAAFKGLRLA